MEYAVQDIKVSENFVQTSACTKFFKTLKACTTYTPYFDSINSNIMFSDSFLCASRF